MSIGYDVTLADWRAFIETKIGFVLPESQYGWLKNAIHKTAKQHRLSDEMLYEAVQGDDELCQSLIDAILISETRFFRHKPSLIFVANAFKAHTSTHKETFNVLSVGCSEGHEAWSLAMLLHTEMVGAGFRVLGLDASTRSLAIARQAHYPLRELDDIPSEFYYDLNVDIQHGYFSPHKALNALTAFEYCNLFDGDGLKMAMAKHGIHKAHVIVCQNMLIYFRREDQAVILNRLMERLHDGGYLVLAGGEGLFWQHTQARRIISDGVNVWQKSLDTHDKKHP